MSSCDRPPLNSMKIHSWQNELLGLLMAARVTEAGPKPLMFSWERSGTAGSLEIYSIFEFLFCGNQEKSGNCFDFSLIF